MNDYDIRPHEIRRPSIWCLFYVQNEETKKSWWNYLTQRMTKSKYIHAELYFPTKRESVSITSTTPVTIEKEKPYDPTTYDVVAIDVSWSQFNTIYRRCQLEVGKEFDDAARCNFGISWLIPSDIDDDGVPKYWLCSKLMAYCFVEAGIFPASTIVADVHPGALKMLLKDLKNDPKYRYRKVSLTGSLDQ